MGGKIEREDTKKGNDDDDDEDDDEDDDDDDDDMEEVEVANSKPVGDDSDGEEEEAEDEAAAAAEAEEQAEAEIKKEVKRLHIQEFDSSSDDSEDDEKDKAVVKDEVEVGVTIDKPAYFLLAVMYEQKDNTQEPLAKVSIPITTLPALLGRNHNTKNPQFVSLGDHKALSRFHAAIYYRDRIGGRVGYYGTGTGTNEDNTNNSTSMIYQPKQDNDKDADNVWSRSHPDSDVPSSLATEQPGGFYAIECLSKNDILVNGQRIRKGESAALTNGMAIRMRCDMLYFLLPLNITKGKHLTMPPSITTTINDNNSKKRVKEEENDNKSTTAATVTATEGATPITATTTTHNNNSGSTRKRQKVPPKSSSRRKKPSSSRGDNYEDIPVKYLLQEFHAAVESQRFERRHQLISSSIMLAAVRDAALSTKMQRIFKKNEGIARVEIIDWIASSQKYKQWVERILKKLEIKSYQANLSKSLIKVGYTRVGTTGRHVKWVLPSDILAELDKKDSSSSSSVRRPEKDNKQKHTTKKGNSNIKKKKE